MEVAVASTVFVRQEVLSAMQTWAGMVSLAPSSTTFTLLIEFAFAMSQIPRENLVAMEVRVSLEATVYDWTFSSRVIVPLQTGEVD